MAQLTQPTDVEKASSGSIINGASWTEIDPNTDQAFAALVGNSYELRIVNRYDVEDVVYTKTLASTDVTIDTNDNNKRKVNANVVSYTTTPATPDAYFVQVQAVPTQASGDTASEYGKEKGWDTAYSLTIEIGGREFTLDNDTIQNIQNAPKKFRLKIDPNDPITLTLNDLQDFVTSIGLSVNVSSLTLPDGTNLADRANMEIYALMVDLDNGLAELSTAINAVGAGIPVIPGLAFKRVGLDVKRTDGSI